MILHYKNYDNYESYKLNQVEKPRLKESYIRRKSGRKRRDFAKRFTQFGTFLKDDCRILCLGARFGEEVQAFRELGYHAFGIDLFADESDLVVRGDWNAMPFDDSSYDVVYTNSVDHSFSLDAEIKEICRVLSLSGIVIIDLAIQHCHAAGDERIKAKFANPDRYEAMLWNNDNDVIAPFEKAGFTNRMAWVQPHQWHTVLLERNNG